jgi:hypothetical protein
MHFKSNVGKDFQDLGGASLLRTYNGSLAQLLSSVYTGKEWLPWKFDQIPHSYWEDVNNQKKFIHWAANQLNIKVMSDWYKVTNKVKKSEGFYLSFEGFE